MTGLDVNTGLTESLPFTLMLPELSSNFHTVLVLRAGMVGLSLQGPTS
jgi:hypothetical protein